MNIVHPDSLGVTIDGINEALFFGARSRRRRRRRPHSLGGMFSDFTASFNGSAGSSPDVTAFPEFRMLSLAGLIAVVFAGLVLFYFGRLRRLAEGARYLANYREVARKRSELERIPDERRRKTQ